MKAKIVVSIIWLFFIFCGIKGGIEIPDTEKARLITQSVPLETKLILTLFPLSFGIFISFYARKHQYKKTFIDHILDRILGAGSSDEIARLMRFKILGPLFFLLIGSIGLIKAIIIGLTGIGVYKLLMPLCFGIGLSVSFLLTLLTNENNKNA